jgi:hypothetical protein
MERTLPRHRGFEFPSAARLNGVSFIDQKYGGGGHEK